MATFYLLLGVLGYIFQSLLGSWPGIEFDVMTLIVIHVSFHRPLTSAIAAALLLGLFVDCYSNTPLGLHAGGLLLAVFLTKFFRSRFNLGTFLPQIMSTLAIMVIQGLAMAGLLNIVESIKVSEPEVWRFFLTRCIFTAALAPPALVLFSRLEKSWGRYFFRTPT